MTFVVIAFYKFVPLDDLEALQRKLQDFCKQLGIKGTILLASEGINGTICGTQDSINAVQDFLNTEISDMSVKTSYADEPVFYRMKVRLKKEIVTIGDKVADPLKKVGMYVEPKDWNDLISDPDVLVLDTRNDYEVDIGTFKNAVNPQTNSFRQFPDYVTRLDKHKKIAMFCTGGIRCEKASSYMLAKGFDEVYHLKGGILKYLETIPKEDSLWEGECFVFDQRVAVTQEVKQGSYGQCYACRHPVSKDDQDSAVYQEGVSCPHCYDQTNDRQKARFGERQHQVELAVARQGEPHIREV